jgi:hypothetical protein
MGSSCAIGDRKRLADHLSKCADEGIDAHLTPEFVTSALNALRAFVAQTSYQLESVTAEGNVTVLSVVQRFYGRPTIQRSRKRRTTPCKSGREQKSSRWKRRYCRSRGRFPFEGIDQGFRLSRQNIANGAEHEQKLARPFLR